MTEFASGSDCFDQHQPQLGVLAGRQRRFAEGLDDAVLQGQQIDTLGRVHRDLGPAGVVVHRIRALVHANAVDRDVHLVIAAGGGIGQRHAHPARAADAPTAATAATPTTSQQQTQRRARRQHHALQLHVHSPDESEAPMGSSK
jgi:hypothetical protein